MIHSIATVLKQKTLEIVYHNKLPATQPIFGQAITELAFPSDIKSVLQQQGITRLYKYQEEAYKAILAGKDAIIVAPTGNGKTEAFALPVIQKILESDPGWGPIRQKSAGPRALFIYPTKALSRDQARKLEYLCSTIGLTVAVFDGDTSGPKRKSIYNNPPDILISNPDMIHFHLQNPSNAFRDLLHTIQTIVLDEIHVYNGAFGTNVHFIIRRLERLYGKKQLIGASATIANPEEFGTNLFGRPPEIISCTQGRRGVFDFYIIRPQKGTTVIITDLLSALIHEKRKVLVFTNSHSMAESINLLAQKQRLYTAVHRAGLPQKYRETVVTAFKNDRLDGIIATPTLELGIDIGNLDAVISTLIGFTRLTQRIGRAGRKGQESLAFLVLRPNDPISEYYANHPEVYFSDIDPVYIEPRNELIAFYQLLAAAFDQPLTDQDFPEYIDIKKKLLEIGLLTENSKNKLLPAYRKALQAMKQYNIRGPGETVRILHGNKRIGERNMPLAADELHKGAIYLHGGQLFTSTRFGFDGTIGAAALDRLPKDWPYRTKALVSAHPDLLEIIATQRIENVEVLYGKFRITRITNGYLQKDLYTDTVIEEHTLEQPIIYSYVTRGFIFQAPLLDNWSQTYLEKQEDGSKYHSASDLITGSYHALEHVLIESSNMLTGGGSTEIGGISLGTSGLIVVYDGTPGGSGASKLLFNHLSEAFKRAELILTDCTCDRDDGCPRCTYSFQCGNNNRPLNKHGAQHLTNAINQGIETSVNKQDFSLFQSLI